jgi:hypothetical protein
MKKQILCCALLSATLLLNAASSVQSLVVQAKGGSETAIALSTVQRITFSGSNLLVSKKDGTQSSFTTANVQKLLFGLRSATAISETSTVSNNLRVYPNPAVDVLFVKGVSSNKGLKVYNITGVAQAVPSTLIADGLQLNVGALPQGVYLIQVNNKTIKFQKQ